MQLPGGVQGRRPTGTQPGSYINQMDAKVYVAVLRAVLTRTRLRLTDHIPGTGILVDDILSLGLI